MEIEAEIEVEVKAEEAEGGGGGGGESIGYEILEITGIGGYSEIGKGEEMNEDNGGRVDEDEDEDEDDIEVI